MTGGVSSWIGVVDLNRNPESPPDHRWTDRSQMDYRNWNGSEPDSQQDPASAWYTKPTNEVAPSVCKKPAKYRDSRILPSVKETAQLAEPVRGSLPATTTEECEDYLNQADEIAHERKTEAITNLSPPLLIKSFV